MPVIISFPSFETSNYELISIINCEINISHEKTWTCLRKGNSKRKTDSLLKAAPNNAIRTNHIRARIDKTHKIANVGYVMRETKQSITSQANEAN